MTYNLKNACKTTFGQIVIKMKDQVNSEVLDVTKILTIKKLDNEGVKIIVKEERPGSRKKCHQGK